MVAAKRDSYKRVYMQDGKYSYPKTDDNIAQKKGDLYFKSLEITGSSEGLKIIKILPLESL